MSDHTTIIIAGVGGAIGLLGLIWFISTYNRLVRLRNLAKKTWADIDVLLQQRYDILPNLVNAVKGYASHEKEIFEQFAQARQMAAGARQSGDVGALGQAEGMLSNIMPRINMVAEQYPELKADSSFVNLQNQIVAIENQVADRREGYNAGVTNWNTAIEMFPASIVAGVMSATQMDTFTVVSAEVRAAPVVSF